MACTDLDCCKHDTGYPHDWFLPDHGGQPLQKFFEHHTEEAEKCTQQPYNGPKNGYYAPDFPEKIAKNCLTLSVLWTNVMLGKCTMEVFTFSW